MSNDIELQDMSDDHQPQEEHIYVNLSSSTPSNKTRPCSSTIVRYRCAVVFLGVLCALLAIIIRVMSINYSIQRTVTARHEIAPYSVDVTLDPDTAHNKLILSADGKQVKHGDTSQNRPDNPKRFDLYANVMGMQGFSSGKFYYEVQVSGKTAWYMGVARESIDRNGEIALSPTNGCWTIRLWNSQYAANAGPDVTLSLKEKPAKVGVFVDYGAGLVSFYDVHRWSLIYFYEGVSFREKIYPFFSPYINDKGKNSAPLVITPVSCA